MGEDIANLIGPVSRHFLGTPTQESAKELRFGTHGSLSISLETGQWYDHENQEGGGVVDLIRRELPDSGNGAVARFLEGFGATQRPEPEPVVRLAKPKKKVLEEYEYRDQDNNLKYIVVRFEPKDFRQKQIVDGAAVWNLQGVNLLPWRLPQILERKNEPLYIVEGEKCVQALEAIGLLATCNSGGSGKWQKNFANYFQGREIIIFPDNDPPGEKHALDVLKSFEGLAQARIIHLPGLEGKGDVADYLQQHTKEDLLEQVNKAPEQSTPIPILTMAEISQMPPTKWLIDGVIPERSMSLIYGAPGNGKTFLALDMCLSIAHRESWHGCKTQPGATVYVAGEGVGGLRKRLLAWHQEKQKELEAPLYVIPQSVGLIEEEEVQKLLDTIRLVAKEPIRAVVFDTLARCMAADENSAQDMGDAIRAMDRVRTELECAVIPIHHAGKDATRGARGSTALIGAVDVSLLVKRDDNILRMETEKQKDAEALPPLLLASKQITLQAQNALEDVETSLVLEPYTGDEPTRRTSLSGVQRTVYEALLESMYQHGERVPDYDGLQVAEGRWREVAKGMILTDGGDEARRKAFYRAAQELQKKGLITKRMGHVGLLERDTERDIMDKRKSLTDGGMGHDGT